MRVVGGRVGRSAIGGGAVGWCPVGGGHSAFGVCRQRVGWLLAGRKVHHRLVYTLPVVYILTLAPLFLECGLALVDGHGVVEVPGASLLLLCRRQPVAGQLVAHGALLLQLLLGGGLLCGPLLLLFLLLELFYHPVYGLVALGLGQFCEHLERVLQVDGVGERHQFVEHLRPFRQQRVVGPVLVEQPDGLAVAPLGVVVLLPGPVEVAEFQQQHALFDAAAGRFLVASLIRRDGVQRVLPGQVDVADGVVHLVEVVFVLVRLGHSAQPLYHLLRTAPCHDLGLGYAGVELHFVRRVLPHHLAVSLVCRLPVAEPGLQLSHQKPLAGFLLLAPFVLDDLGKVFHGLVVLLAPYVVVGIGVVPLFHGLVVHGVALHLRYHVFSVVKPIELGVAFGEPRPCYAVYLRLCGVQARHV